VVLTLNTNVAALSAYRSLSVTDNRMTSSLEKLSSGLRIGRAADDAAGLGISEGLRSRIGGLKVAVRNAQDGISVAQTADGALGQTHAVLQRMRDLSVQAANGNLTVDARAALQKENDVLAAELTRIANQTSFNGVPLLDGSYQDKVFQLGPGRSDSLMIDIGQGAAAIPATLTGPTPLDPGRLDFSGPGMGLTVVVSFDDTGRTWSWTSTAAFPDTGTLLAHMDFAMAPVGGLPGGGTWSLESGRLALTSMHAGATSKVTMTVTPGPAPGAYDLGLATGTAVGQPAALGGFDAPDLGVGALDLTTETGSATAIGLLDRAIRSVSTARAELGAVQNRFDHAIGSMGMTHENLASAQSRIRDTDIAQEMVRFSRSQILSQAGTAMLAQATQTPHGVLQLLR
jgi:flagellin